MATQQLSENEVWDDSALVQSWNDALSEYKKYHSIAARGERVEDILDTVEKAEKSQPTDIENDKPFDETTGLPPWRSVEGTEPVDSTATDPKTANVEAPTSNSNQSHPPDVSQTLLNSDENLKNLMMSWYYAGYYTGLHEGQQKANAAQQKSGK